MDTFVRWAGGCWVGVGILLLAELAHPDALSIGFAASSRQALWPTVHVAWVLATVLTLFGVAGLVARVGRDLGGVGLAGAVLAVPGVVVAAGLFLVEAFAFPVLARRDDSLLDFDGPLLGETDLRVAAGLAGLWFLGLVLTGFAVERSHVLSRGAGEALAGAAVVFAALEGPFVPIAGKVAVVLFSAVHVWLGRALMLSARRDAPSVAV